MTRSKRRFDLSQSHCDLEDSHEGSPLPDGSRPRGGRLRPSVLEMKALSQQMSPALHRNEQVLKEEEEKLKGARAETRTTTVKCASREVVGSAVDVWGLQRDLAGCRDRARDWTRKVKLFVTSIALLEEEIRALVSECLEFKRNLLRKKLEVAYSELRKARREKDLCREQYLMLIKQVKTLTSLPTTPFAMD